MVRQSTRCNCSSRLARITTAVSIWTALVLSSEYCLATPVGNDEVFESESRGAQSIYFSHQDQRLLTPGLSVSSVAYLPRKSPKSTHSSLLVLLHGTNESRTLYPWFGGSEDLRPMLSAIAAESDRSFIVAAPTQTRSAWLARNMWADFELEAFVSDLRKALPEGFDIDLHATYIAGHSAAGCNPTGGLVGSSEVVSGVALAGIAFIDTCFDVAVAERLSGRNPEINVWVLWQNLTWRREPAPFIAAMSVPKALPIKLIEFQPRTVNPHVGVMYSAVEMLVREWLLGEVSGSTKEGQRTKQSVYRPNEVGST